MTYYTRNPWLDWEINLIDERAEVYPLKKIARIINNRRIKNGLSPRSIESITSKIHRLGYKTKSQCDYLTKRQISGIFGISEYRVKKLELKESYNRISIKTVLEAIKQHPEKLGSIDRDRLLFFTTDLTPLGKNSNG